MFYPHRRMCLRSPLGLALTLALGLALRVPPLAAGEIGAADPPPRPRMEVKRGSAPPLRLFQRIGFRQAPPLLPLPGARRLDWDATLAFQQREEGGANALRLVLADPPSTRPNPEAGPGVFADAGLTVGGRF